MVPMTLSSGAVWMVPMTLSSGAMWMVPMTLSSGAVWMVPMTLSSGAFTGLADSQAFSSVHTMVATLFGGVFTAQAV